MEVDPEAVFSMLSVRFRHSDNGKSIRVRVGDTVLFAETLNHTGTSATYDVRIPIPPAVLTRCLHTVAADGRDVPVLDVTFSANDDEESAKICDFVYMNAVKPYYEFDTDIAYFVDCGDQDVTTLTGIVKLGWYNSVTEQLMGNDEVSGMRSMAGMTVEKCRALAKVKPPLLMFLLRICPAKSYRPPKR